MNNTPWQSLNPFDAIIFDCDGTLTAIEGIDELAHFNDVYEPVKKMTELAMDKGLLNEALFSERLSLVKPSALQLAQLSNLYIEKRIQYVRETIQLLLSLNKQVYIVSAGLTPAVIPFGQYLGVDKKNIYAVDIYFDEEGRYRDFERTTPLINSDGKRHIISTLKQKHAHLLLVGDGMNDFLARESVDRFVGFGGVYYRQVIEAQCEFYIRCNTLLALLPLALTPTEIKQLSSEYYALYLEGFALMQRYVTMEN